MFLPMMTMNIPVGNVHNISASPEISKNALVQKLNITSFGVLATNKAVDPEEEAKKAQAEKAEAIDAYFADHDMPLEGTGLKMVEEADKNDLDWRLLPAIAVRESTGGKFECKKVKNNAFGWGSCKIGFKSNEQAIEVVARNLGGNNPKTAHHYDSKTTLQVLRAYNPPSIVPKYAEQVISIMNTIGDEEMSSTLAMVST